MDTLPSLSAVANDVTAPHPLPVGTTLIQGTVSIHRYADSLTLTDLTNAGKRGKKCRVAAILRSCGPNRPETLDGYARSLAEYDSYDRCMAFLKDMLVDYPGGIEIDEHEKRGIDVPPATEKPVVIGGMFVRVEATPRDFVIRDLVDRNNEPTAIPTCKGGKPSIQVFYRWAQANADRIRDMRFHDILSEAGTLGVRYHYYCAVD